MDCQLYFHFQTSTVVTPAFGHPTLHYSDPLISFEPVYEFALQTGYIQIKPKQFYFPKHGLMVLRDDVDTAPKNDDLSKTAAAAKTTYRNKIEPEPKNDDLSKTAEAAQTTTNKPAKNPPPKKISVHPKKLQYIATKFQNGFERQVVSKTLEMVRPVLLYTMDTDLIYDVPIKELQFGGYQIFRYASCIHVLYFLLHAAYFCFTWMKSYMLTL